MKNTSVLLARFPKTVSNISFILPETGKYDFTILREDLEYLKSYRKRLFIQLQDVTFNIKYKAVPDYLLTEEYDGGVVMQYNDDDSPGGWVAQRWNKKVRCI